MGNDQNAEFILGDAECFKRGKEIKG
jgi:hypothetical protein